MFAKVSEMQDRIDFKQYRDDVLSGNLYTKFHEELIRRQEIVDADGDPLLPEYEWYQKMEKGEIKGMFFFILFSKNKDTSKEKELFAELYPSVYEVFRFIKQYDHSLLSVLLQQIEAKLILDRVVPRIMSERPGMRLYTIHDAVATTKPNVKDLKDIMKEEATAATGYEPNFKTEVWNPESSRLKNWGR